MSDSAFYDTTAEYRAGLDFSYASWTADTRVTLANVPWNNDYRDVVKFENTAALDRYINGRQSTRAPITNINYAKPTAPIRLNVPFSVAYRYNYLRAALPIQPIGNGEVAKTYYYFVTNVEYVAPNVTQFNLQLDIFQTFNNEWRPGNSYIERGHIGIANKKNFDNYGRDYLTIPEGLDIGNEYRHVAKRTRKLFEKNTGNVFRDMNILVVSTTKLDSPAGQGDEKKPILLSAGGDNMQGIPSGAEQYVFRNLNEFKGFMNSYQSVPWITQGIISITVIPNVFKYGYTLKRLENTRNKVAIYKFVGGEGLGYYGPMMNDWRNSMEILGDIPSRYRHLRKFMTSPYLMVEVTTWTGGPIVLRPEAWADPHARLHEKVSLGAPNGRIVIYPHKYNANPSAAVEQRNNGQHTDFYDDNGDYLDISVQVSNFPTLSIVNNGAISFMASNAAGLNQQFANADWSQSRALAGNQLSYDQAGNAIDSTMAQGANARNADALTTAQANQMAGLGALKGVAGSTVGGIASKNIGVAVGGVASNAFNFFTGVDNNNTNLAIRQNASTVSQNISVGQAGYMRDTTKGLADWAARGDYSQSIASINAKVQDAKLTQPSTSGQVGGEVFNIINDSAEVSVRFKMIGPAEIRVIGEYWLRYGYAVRQFGVMPESLMVMTKFTYWKLSEMYISTSAIPEMFKQALRGIFEKGVTVWKDPDDIGNIDIADNEALPDILIDDQPGTPEPIPFPEPEYPAYKDDTDMYVIKTPDATFVVGKEYARILDASTGTTIPLQVIAEDATAHELSEGQATGLFNSLGIPGEYSDPTVFRAAYPDGIWSRDLVNQAIIEQNDRDVKTILSEILAGMTPDDGAGA